MQKLSKEGTAALDEILYSAKACYAKESKLIFLFLTLCSSLWVLGRHKNWTCAFRAEYWTQPVKILAVDVSQTDHAAFLNKQKVSISNNGYIWF